MQKGMRTDDRSVDQGLLGRVSALMGGREHLATSLAGSPVDSRLALWRSSGQHDTPAPSTQAWVRRQRQAANSWAAGAHGRQARRSSDCGGWGWGGRNGPHRRQLLVARGKELGAQPADVGKVISQQGAQAARALLGQLRATQGGRRGRVRALWADGHHGSTSEVSGSSSAPSGPAASGRAPAPFVPARTAARSSGRRRQGGWCCPAARRRAWRGGPGTAGRQRRPGPGRTGRRAPRGPARRGRARWKSMRPLCAPITRLWLGRDKAHSSAQGRLGAT